ncbi:MlaD family protein, partial [Couchioplanes caeruleus subsp. azureus]|uniref:MlaD family protein n=1 Tax=Couchioplanes caeruleus TaxID=56438 RepID=UPI0036228167
DINEYDIFFKQSVDGLARGSEVSFSGVPAGHVKDIELWERDPEFVRVRISVDRRVPILQGTTASLLGSFTGVSTIQLSGAHKGAPAIECPRENPRATCPEGVPVIPTKRSGLGEILSNAPLLLERLATLTERLTMVLSDKNQKSIENILANTDRLTGPVNTRLPKVVKAPEGHTYAWTENPLGINGYYLVSRGEKTPWRLKLRTASYANVQAL